MDEYEAFKNEVKNYIEKNPKFGQTEYCGVHLFEMSRPELMYLINILIERDKQLRQRMGGFYETL